MDIDRCDLWSVILRSRDPGVAELSFVCDLIWYVCRCVYIYMYTYICIYIFMFYIVFQPTGGTYMLMYCNNTHTYICMYT